MGKMAVLKPIIWNNGRYERPAGSKSTKGYTSQHGYGHEEWNNNPRWFWQGWKVFHTESTDVLRRAARQGGLGMVMVASKDGIPYAMGVAANVYANGDDEPQNPRVTDQMKRIAQAVAKDKEGSAVWSLATVKEGFGDREDLFRRHWEQEHPWIQWRCLPDYYHWFGEPIRLDPQRVAGKRKLAMYHGRFTLTTPEVILDIIDAHLPNDRSAIRDWFSSDDFDRPDGRHPEAYSPGSNIRDRVRHGGNAPTDRRFQYWVEGIRNVEPHHHRLQTLFTRHLAQQGIWFRENIEYVDVRYAASDTTTLCEINPTDNVSTRYAIRAAVGQLLEYRFTTQNPSVKLMIVLGSEPTETEKAFVKSLGLGLTFYDSKKETFIIA